jgi:hypothetical protein
MNRRFVRGKCVGQMKDAFGCDKVRLKRGCGAFPGSALARLWVNGEANKRPAAPFLTLLWAGAGAVWGEISRLTALPRPKRQRYIVAGRY